MLPRFSTHPPLILPRRVLVVDDDPARGRTLVERMLQEGYEVQQRSLEEAVAPSPSDPPPDLILLNIMADGDAGPPLCGQLRTLETCRTTPIVALTPPALDEPTAVRLLMSGADDYMCAPLRMDELVARVHVQLRNQRDREMLRWTQQQHRSLRTAVRLDALTGVPNRRAADEALARAVAGAEPMMLLLADVDHFKRINDYFGHQVGDTVLKAIATRLQERTRGGDLLARFGGEEFLVVIRRAPPHTAQRIGDRFRRAVEELSVDDHESGPQHLTVSVGIAVWGGQGSAPSAATMLETADEALYRAKDAGRNCVRIHNVRRGSCAAGREAS